MPFIRKYKRELIVTAVCAAVLAAFYIFHPRCVIEELSGVPCPTCGMTRAWLSALRGDLVRAFRFHPLFWAVPPLYLFLFFREKFPPRAQTAIALSATALFAAVWLLRLLVIKNSLIYIS